jgi:hypothetical protein
MVTENAARLAVLIDADNAQPSIVEGLLAEVAKYGTAHVKRAYGDWTGTNLRGWKDQLLAQSIQPVQQFAYTSGKNATDAAMVIDAMDLLYSERFDGFCIVSSDSDFTRLAARLRQVHLRREPDLSGGSHRGRGHEPSGEEGCAGHPAQARLGAGEPVAQRRRGHGRTTTAGPPSRRSATSSPTSSPTSTPAPMAMPSSATWFRRPPCSSSTAAGTADGKAGLLVIRDKRRRSAKR